MRGKAGGLSGTFADDRQECLYHLLVAQTFLKSAITLTPSQNRNFFSKFFTLAWQSQPFLPIPTIHTDAILPSTSQDSIAGGRFPHLPQWASGRRFPPGRRTCIEPVRMQRVQLPWEGGRAERFQTFGFRLGLGRRLCRHCPPLARAEAHGSRPRDEPFPSQSHRGNPP
jgi:hypothetical protein